MVAHLMDPAVLLALAAVFSAAAKLVWSFRRRR
jgi:hypothetical protein